MARARVAGSVSTPPNQRRPRVAVLRNNFLPYSETFIHDELRSHVRYKPFVLARACRNLDRFQGHDVTAIERGTLRSKLASLQYGVTGVATGFDQALREKQPTLIHAHFGNNGAYAVGFARRHELPLVVSLHGHDVTVLLSPERWKPDWWFYTAMRRDLFRYTTLFLAASEELAELIVRSGAPAERVRVHRLGIDVEAMVQLSAAQLAMQRPPAPPKLIMVGRFVEKKGHEYGLHAAALLKQRGFRFTLDIVGDGPLRHRYERLVRKLRLEEVVTCQPNLPHRDVLARIAEARVMLTPSVVANNLDRESGVIVIKEACSLGTPVVATWHGGIPEIINDRQTGLLVPERDPEAMANAVGELLSSGELHATIAAAAREKVRREYDLHAATARLESFYDEAVALHRRTLAR